MDSNQNKYTTIYGKSEVIFQDKIVVEQFQDLVIY